MNSGRDVGRLSSESSDSDESDASGARASGPSSSMLSSAESGWERDGFEPGERELVVGRGPVRGDARFEVSRGRKERFGVDFDWKPEGTELPRLWGGMTLQEM